uniref:NADH-ubiquinone oxidoreductase chain 2 n=1 Tax=Cyrtanaspis phalerata TaxID=1587452 RepID=A0A343C2U5_9CUCU|nr:NADH dehydrogenase subunit 2 [Cyrtanaspis phalerata]
MFLNLMIMGTMISVSSYSWFSMWMGLEINLLSIIPLFNNTKNMFSSEASMKYFIVQAMASMILLFSIIMMFLLTEFINPLMNSNLLMIMNSALLMKIGSAPFHFWFPEVMEGLNWMNCLILLTWQKIAPMVLIMNNNLNVKFLFIITIFCLLVSALMGFNQISLRKIMAFSSINHIGWMISSMMISKSIWFIYFSIYTFISINLISIFLLFNCYFINQLISLLNSNKMIKINFMMNFLSLGGLPPFIGFLPKWLNVNWLINNNNFLLAFILIILTLITLFIYIRIMFSTIVIMHNEFKLKLNSLNYSFLTFNFISLILLMFSTMMFNYL